MQTLQEKLSRVIVSRIPSAECLLRPPLLTELEEYSRRSFSVRDSYELFAETLYKEIEQRLRRIRALKANFSDFEEDFVQKIVAGFLKGELEKLDKQICQKEIAAKVESLMRALPTRAEAPSSNYKEGLTALCQSLEKSNLVASVFCKAGKFPFTQNYFESFDAKAGESGRTSVIQAIAQRSKLKTAKTPELEAFVSLIRHPRLRETVVTSGPEASQIQLIDHSGCTFAVLEASGASFIRLVSPERQLWRQSVESISASLSLSFLAKVKEAINFCVKAFSDSAST